jgi:NTP pyrophosphatase (non-canonical NTP hydrolase)
MNGEIHQKKLRYIVQSHVRNIIMEIKEFQELVKRTANIKVSGDMQLFDYTLGLVGEAGEVADCIKKAIFHQVVMDKKTKEEMGDLLWYIASLCNLYGWKLSDILDENIEKLKKRYPNGFELGGGIR